MIVEANSDAMRMNLFLGRKGVTVRLMMRQEGYVTRRGNQLNSGRIQVCR